MEHLITDDADATEPFRRNWADVFMGAVLALLGGFAFYGIGRFIADFFQ